MAECEVANGASAAGKIHMEGFSPCNDGPKVACDDPGEKGILGHLRNVKIAISYDFRCRRRVTSVGEPSRKPNLRIPASAEAAGETGGTVVQTSPNDRLQGANSY